MYEYVVAILAVLFMWWKNRAELAKVRAVLQETESQLEASRKLSRAIDGDRQNIANKHNELVNHSSAVTRFGLSVAHVTTTAVAAAKQTAAIAAKQVAAAAKQVSHAESIANQHAEAAAAAQARARASDTKAKEAEGAGVALDQVIDRLVAGRKRARPV
jgi:hypothetical protein